MRKLRKKKNERDIKANLKRWRQLQKEATARARALGIYTEKDVERIVDEVREEEDKKRQKREGKG